MIRVKSKQKPEMEFVSKSEVLLEVRVSFSISLFCFDSGFVITVGCVVVVGDVEAVDVVVVVVVGDSVRSFGSG